MQSNWLKIQQYPWPVGHKIPSHYTNTILHYHQSDPNFETHPCASRCNTSFDSHNNLLSIIFIMMLFDISMVTLIISLSHWGMATDP